MKISISLTVTAYLLFCSNFLFANVDADRFITVDSTKGARINVYLYEGSGDSIKEKPILLVHGFNSNGSVWRSEKNNYVQELTRNGYDVMIVEMRGNPVDTDGDHRIDEPVVGDSWGYGVRDLGDDVGTALMQGIEYLNRNLTGRNYKKADVITHSTGALAVTSYSRSLSLVPYRNNIDTVIELAPPNNGSTSLIANIKQVAQIIPSLFTQSMIAYEYALEFSDTKVWIPGGRMESENLRKELMPESLFLKSIKGLGPVPTIKTFIAIGDEDWVVGNWSPVIGDREDVGYEYFLGVDHFSFCESGLIIAALLDKLEKCEGSRFFKRYNPYRNKSLLSFLSGPGIDHPDDTFDVVTFAKNINISPRQLFELYLRIAGRKNKDYLLKYWDALTCFEKAQEEKQSGGEGDIVDKWKVLLGQKNELLHNCYICASEEYLECPDIAILANGYYNELAKLIIEKLCEPVRIVDHTFSPSILNEQKVLLIPSGGLSGLSASEIFRKKLCEFVKNGGTLICFSQQHGYDFNALPEPGLKGYGWEEDVSCHLRAAYIENFHQILSSQNELYPDIKIDGYFTDYPSGAKILIRRTKNLMPAMLMYNFGNGVVVAATIYTDWGYLNGQASSSEIGLIRDIVRWSKTSNVLPEYKVSEDFSRTINVCKDFSKIEMILKSPDNTVIERRDSTSPVFEIGAALDKPGIYCVDYILYNSACKVIQPQTEGFYFCFSQPPEGSIENPNFTFDITSDSENYIEGAEAMFSFHIKNNTNQNEIVKCKAGFNHHAIKFTESIEIPAGTLVSFDKKIIMTKTDILTADLYSSGNSFLGRAERGISVFTPNVDATVKTNKMQYAPGQIIKIDSGIKNNLKSSVALLLVLSIVDSQNNGVYYNTKMLELYGEEGDSWKEDFKIPEDTMRGMYKIKLDAFSNFKLVGSATANVDIPGPLVCLDDKILQNSSDLLTIEMEKLVYSPDEPILAKVTVNNKDEVIDSAVLDIRMLPSVEIGDLWGIIRDDKGEVIDGARVNNVYTNSEGRYKLEKINRGKYVLNIEAPGYDRISKEIEMLGGDNNLDASLSATKYGNLSGAIEDAVGSCLTLEPLDVRGSDACVRHAVVSKEGKFEFKHLPVGTYRLNVQPEGITEIMQIKEGESTFVIASTFASLSVNSAKQSQEIALSPSAPRNDKETQEVEPNNDFETATEITLAAGIRGEIYDYGDEDYFRLTIDLPSILNISLKNVAQGFRPHITIYDSNKRWLDSVAAFSGEEIEYSLEISMPGLYYLYLKDRYNTFSSQEGYVLGIDLVQGTDQYEPNLDFNTAKEINLKEEMTPTIFPKGDEDYFSVNIKEKGIYYVEMQALPEGFRPSMKIYNSTGKLISQKGGASGEKIALEAEIEEPGQYYLLVKDWYSSFSSLEPYSFKAYFIKTLDEYEPNNTKEEADPLEFGKTYFATIATKGDSDFYKLSVPDSGKARISLKDLPQNIRPYIKLYKDTSASWIDSTAGAAGEDLTMEFRVDKPSNWYIQIQDRYNSETSFLRYRLLAAYIPDDGYLLEDIVLFKKNIELSNITHKEEIEIEIPGMREIGKYYLQAALRSSILSQNSQVVERFYVGDPDILLEPAASPEIAVSCMVDEDSVFKAGEKVYFKFKAINKGTGCGPCKIDFKFMDLFNQTQTEFLEAGDEKDLEFEFQLPTDLEEGLYEAEYAFGGEKRVVNFKVLGVKIRVEAELENSIFKINVQNKGSIKEAGLFAEIRYGNFEDKKIFMLQDREELIFNIPDLDSQEKIYYGIYFASGKALYLSSFSLNEEVLPDIFIKVIEAACDKNAYRDGEQVLLKWKVESQDACSVRLLADLVSPDTNITELIDEYIDLTKGINVLERWVIPEFIKAGLYKIIYSFLYEESVAAQGSVFFDVGDEVRVELRIDKKEFREDENIKLTSCCFSSADLKGDLMLILDDKEVERLKDVNIDGYKEFNFNIKVSEIGQHKIYSSLCYSKERIDSNMHRFNILPKPKPNHSPVLFTIGEKRVETGEVLEFFVEAQDLDGDELFYSTDTLPDGAGFGLETRKFSWRPGHEQFGEYLVTFKVSDGKESAFERARIIVTKTPALPPSARPLAEPLRGMAPLEVHFSAQAINKDKKIVKYEWDFDGKGVYDFASLESGDVMFIYTSEGNFPAVLRVTDKEGHTEEYKVTISVAKNTNAPEVFLEASPLKGLAPCKVYFKGSVTSSADICRYEWDFDGDGVYDASSTGSGGIVKTYTLPGTYNVEFKVTSSEGLSSPQGIKIEILDPHVFKIKPLISDYTGSVPIEVCFDAVIDAENGIQKYQWDFEGAGVYDFTSTSSAVAMHTYFRPGVYMAILKVTDEKNISAQCKTEIRFGVADAEDIKKGKMIVESRKGKGPFTVRFSFDADLDAVGARYFWDFDGDHAYELVTILPEAEYVYYDSGVYLAGLSVKHGDDFIDTCQEVIYVTNGKNNGNIPNPSDSLGLEIRENVQKDKECTVELSDKTCLFLPAGSLGNDDTVSIKKLEGHQILKEIILGEGNIVSVGEYREYKFKNQGSVLDNEMIITIPYKDEDNDGYIDGRDINEMTLDAYWFDEEDGTWKILSDVLVFPKENIVTIKTNHFSVFGIAGLEKAPENTAFNSGGNAAGSVNCFIATVAFGTPLAEEVRVLCEFRDRYLIKSELGRNIVSFYYLHGPPVASFIKNRPLIKALLRFHIKILVKLIQFIL